MSSSTETFFPSHSHQIFLIPFEPLSLSQYLTEIFPTPTSLTSKSETLSLHNTSGITRSPTSTPSSPCPKSKLPSDENSFSDSFPSKGTIARQFPLPAPFEGTTRRSTPSSL
ncbi:hypothetical protein Hanom_Chr16g01461491 [Helianthus anomalus]